MSGTLFENMMERFCFIEKTREPDGEGGFITAWSDGASFDAALILDQSMTARSAEKQGVTSVYTLTFKPGVPIDFHTVIRRMSDGEVFRVTSEGGEKKAPVMASFELEQVTAEKWSLPT